MSQGCLLGSPPPVRRSELSHLYSGDGAQGQECAPDGSVSVPGVSSAPRAGLRGALLLKVIHHFCVRPPHRSGKWGRISSLRAMAQHLRSLSHPQKPGCSSLHLNSYNRCKLYCIYMYILILLNCVVTQRQLQHDLNDPVMSKLSFFPEESFPVGCKLSPRCPSAGCHLALPVCYPSKQ